MDASPSYFDPEDLAIRERFRRYRCIRRFPFSLLLFRSGDEKTRLLLSFKSISVQTEVISWLEVSINLPSWWGCKSRCICLIRMLSDAQF